MRSGHKIIIGSILGGISFWIIDAVIDTFVFYEGTLLNMLLFKPSIHEMYMRTIIGIIFILFGILVSKSVNNREQIVEDLKESEERFRGLFESSADGIIMAGLKTKSFRYANPAICRMLGYTEDELCRMGLTDIHPKEKLAQVLSEFEAQARKEKTLAIDIPCLRKDGTIIYADVNTRPTLIGGHEYNVGFFRDATERRKTEQTIRRSEEKIKKLNDLLNALRKINQQLLHVKNENELYQQICNSLSQVSYIKFVWIGLVEKGSFDVKPVAYAGFEDGYSSTIKVTWDDSEYGKGSTGTAIKTGKPFITPDISSDHRYLPWKKEALKRGYTSVMALPLMYEGEVIGALNVYSSEKNTFRDEETMFLVEAADNIAIGVKSLRTEGRLGESEQARLRAETTERFIATATHELRTPLVSIEGYTDLALKGKLGPLSEQLKSSLQIVNQNAKRLHIITEDILDIRRIESGKLTLNLQLCNFQEILDDCVREIQPFLKEKQNLTIETPKKPLPINCDHVRLSQVIMNLLNNAAKFTPENGKIHLNVKDETDHIKVQVSDTGIGIRKEDLKRVFEPLADIKKPTYIKGTGLGLSVTKGLVEAHGGEIFAESPGEGKGSTFTFTLPKNRGG